MSEQLPKFEDLSAVNVNDLIATEIMGWHSSKDHNLFGVHEWWCSPDQDLVYKYEKERFVEPTPDLDDYRPFNPYESLDDCHLAEEKLYDAVRKIPGTYLPDVYMAELFGPYRGETIYDQGWHGAHMTAKTKCRCMLVAIKKCQSAYGERIYEVVREHRLQETIKSIERIFNKVELERIQQAVNKAKGLVR